MNFTYLTNELTISNGVGIRLLTIREKEKNENTYLNIFLINRYETKSGLTKEHIIDQTGINPNGFNLFQAEKVKEPVLKLLEVKIKQQNKKVDMKKLEEVYCDLIKYARNVIQYEDEGKETRKYSNKITKINKDYKEQLKTLSKDYPILENINLEGNQTNLARVKNNEIKIEKVKEIENKKYNDFLKEIETKYRYNVLDYVQDKSKYLILNEEANISKDILLSFMIVRGAKSVLNNRHGASDSGKSFSMETALNYYIPAQYIIKQSSQTEASFINDCIGDSKRYDRKIIYMGDLGDKEHFERMKPVFNVCKILISEGYYNHKKMANDNEKQIPIELEGIIGLFYQTVIEEDADKTNQLDSRSFISSPALNDKTEKIKFSNRIKKQPYPEHSKFNKAADDLQQFKKYFGYMIKKFNVDASNCIIINPFLEYTFLKLTELSTTETRQLDIIGNMFDSYCCLCHKRCFNVKSEEFTYLIPRIEDVQKFINLIYSNVGLKTYERNLLLFLNKHVEPLPIIDNATQTKLTGEELYNEIEEKEMENNPNINLSILKTNSMKKLFILYGLPQKKETIINGQDELTSKKGKCFFTVSNIKRRFHGNKEIKDIDNLNKCLIDLSLKGFLGQLEEKKGKANIYYLNKKKMDEIEGNYIMQKKDKNKALEHLQEINRNYSNTDPLINTQMFNKIKENYLKTKLNKIINYC